MVVLITHAGGLVALYATLMTMSLYRASRPASKCVHFVVWRDGELIDPLAFIQH